MTKKRRPQPLPRDVSRPFVTLDEACSYGGFGRTYAYKLIHAGAINAIKLGRHTMVERASIDRFYGTLPKACP